MCIRDSAVSDEVERQLTLLPRESIARPAIENNSYIAVMDGIEDMLTVMNDCLLYTSRFG